MGGLFHEESGSRGGLENIEGIWGFFFLFKWNGFCFQVSLSIFPLSFYEQRNQGTCPPKPPWKPSSFQRTPTVPVSLSLRIPLFSPTPYTSLFLISLLTLSPYMLNCVKRNNAISQTTSCTSIPSPPSPHLIPDLICTSKIWDENQLFKPWEQTIELVIPHLLTDSQFEMLEDLTFMHFEGTLGKSPRVLCPPRNGGMKE